MTEFLDDPDILAVVRHEIARRRRSAEAARAAEAAKRAEKYANGPTLIRTEKRCPVCQEVKPVAAYGRNAARPDGLQAACRSCR